MRVSEEADGSAVEVPSATSGFDAFLMETILLREQDHLCQSERKVMFLI